jgi:NAD(P)-dependent dehydrogenase (short-subunit alcohol dehydrogenase family)
MNQVFQQGLFKDKVAFFAGGSSGINLAIAMRFAQLGAQVALISRSADKVQAAVAQIEQQGGRAFGQAADVRDYAAVDAALAATHERAGPIDFVVSGAAGNFVATALGMSPNAFKTVVDIDLLGTFNVLRAAHARLRRPGASIISISAGQAFMPMMGQSHVGAAKAGVDMLTRNLAVEWGGDGVRVNSIVPGPIEDTEGMRRLGGDPKIAAAIKRMTPLQRFGRKDEIADLAVFLCSPAAAYITGTVMICDGGQSLLGSGGFMPG